MKIKFYIFALISLVLVSCDKNEITESKTIEYNDYSSSVNENRVLVAQSLNEAINEDPQLLSTIITECKKKFDGDQNVLCKDLFEMPVSNGQMLKIGALLNRSSQSKKIKSAVSGNNYAQKIVAQDDLLQIYYFSPDAESENYEGIVVVPDNMVENDHKQLMVIYKNGSTSFISSDVAPDDNYLVISTNERFYYDNSKTVSGVTSSTGKSMTIVKATFTSMDGVFSVESWVRGQPEVRLNILCPTVSPTTNNLSEVINTTFLYPEAWINKKLFAKNTTKWNETQIQCPYWFSRASDYGRRLIWTEEDGTSDPHTLNQSFTDKLTGITTNFSTTIPATNNDVIFADSWIYYDELSTGKTYTWGIIQFEVSCQ